MYLVMAVTRWDSLKLSTLPIPIPCPVPDRVPGSVGFVHLFEFREDADAFAARAVDADGEPAQVLEVQKVPS